MAARPVLAERWDLQPHPEGGWFRETWRSAVALWPEGYEGQRCAATAIYFALHPGESSRWHAVRSDELWLWHGPGTLLLHVGGAGDEPGAETAAMVGGDLAAGQQPQVLVPGGVWQRALPAGAAPVLVSCVVAPGFDFADFRVH
jgi:predicted cupin superfamily sugar epimerase